MKRKDKTLLVLTPTLPPAQCGVGEYASMLKKQLKHFYIVKCGVFSKGQEENSLTQSNKEILKIVADKNPDYVLIIYHEHHIDQNAEFHNLTRLIKQQFPGLICVAILIETPKGSSKRIKSFIEYLDGIITFDSVMKKKLLNLGKPIIEIPCGSTLSISKDYRKRAISQRESAEFKVLFFGFLNRDKKVEHFINSLDYIPKDLKINLVIKGCLHENANGRRNNTVEYKKRIENLIERKNDRRIQLTDRYYASKEIESLFLESHICVLPFADGASNKRSSLFNSLSLGTPLITTCSQLTSRTLLSDKSIIFIKQNSPQNIATEILAAYDKWLEGKLEKKKVFESFDEKYSWTLIASQMFKFIESIKKRTPFGYSLKG